MAQYAPERAEAAAPAVASPAPLGLSAFALPVFVLGCSSAGFIFPAVGAGSAVVIGIALFYGGLMSLVAGLQEFRQGNTFGATAFCSYAAFWLALGFVLLPGTGILASLVATKSLSQGVGVFLLGWTIYSATLFIAALRISGATIAIFGLVVLTFLAATIGWLAGVGTSTYTTWIQISGWLGILTALAGWYTSLADVLAKPALIAETLALLFPKG